MPDVVDWRAGARALQQDYWQYCVHAERRRYSLCVLEHSDRLAVGRGEASIG